MKSLNKIKRNKSIIVGIVCLCIIVVSAFILPQKYFTYYDKRTENKNSYFDTDVNIYQVEYSTFTEKILEFEKMYESDKINSVFIQNIDDEDTQLRILEALDDELSELKDFLVLPPYLEYSADELKTCRLYSIYDEINENDISAFNYYKLEFEDEDKNVCSVAMDVEFQKIYDIKIEYSYLDNIYMSEEIGEESGLISEAEANASGSSDSDNSLLCEGMMIYYEFTDDFYYNEHYDEYYYNEYYDWDILFYGGIIYNSSNEDFYMPVGVSYFGEYMYIGIYPTENFLQI